MNSIWPKIPLGDVLKKSGRWIKIQPDIAYKQVTVRLWGKGITLRGQVTGVEIAASEMLQVQPYQFILSRIDARNGASGLIPEFLNGAVVSNDFPVYDIDTTRLLPAYLGWMSKTQDFVDFCKKASEGTTNRVRLKEDRFLSTEIPLPPLTEQQRIVAKIDKLAAKIEEARHLRQQTTQGVEQLFTTQRAKTFEELAKRKQTPFDNVATLERGKFSHRPRNEPRFFGGQHPWIQIGEIEASNKFIQTWTETLNDDGLAISRKFPKGTLLVSIAATIGAVGILDFNCCIPDSIVAITPKPEIGSEYIYHYLCYVRRHLEQVAPQSAQKNINLRILRELSVPVLPLTEQQRIVTYLDGLKLKVETMRRQQDQTNTEIDALLPSILDKAFKGEL